MTCLLPPGIKGLILFFKIINITVDSMIATVDSTLIFYSKDFAEFGFTKIDKQNDDDKKTTL